MTTATKDERKERLNGIRQKLANLSEQEKQALTSRGLIATIDGRTLSIRNTFMVYIQARHVTPTVVGGYKQWKQAGRCVKRSEHGFSILFPSGPKDEDGDIIECNNFHAGTVFDVSQTEMPGAADEAAPAVTQEVICLPAPVQNVICLPGPVEVAPAGVQAPAIIEVAPVQVQAEAPIELSPDEERRYKDGLALLARDVFHCPCGKSYRKVAQYFAHQDKCFAWGHYDNLTMSRNKLGGCQAKGDRFMLPKNGSKPGKYVPSKPSYPSYAGEWAQVTEPICGESWVNDHSNGHSIDMPDPVIVITYTADQPVTMVTLAEAYPKMVKRFAGSIAIN